MPVLKNFQKHGLQKAKTSEKFNVELNYFKIDLAYQEKSGLKRDGFLKKIHWVGFNGIVDLKMEEEFWILIRFK